MTVLQRDLNLLVVEDNPGDFVLIEEYLAEISENAEIQHAKTYAEAKTALQQNADFDAILLDLTLPDESGETLVKKVVKQSGHTPVIVLTGYENQEFGLKTLSMGVTDYVLKDEITPFILGKVIAYGMERNKIQLSLQKSERKYRDIFNLSPQPMFLIDTETHTIADVNDAAVQQYGYPKEEFMGLNLKEIRPEEEIPAFEREIEKISQSDSQFYHTHLKHQRKNGEVFTVELSTSEIILDGKTMRMALAEDITKKVESEKSIQKKSQLLAANAKITGALIKNENWLEALSKYLGVIGKAVEVDRVYYFENHLDTTTGELLTSQKIEWTSQGVSSEIDNPILQNQKMEEFPVIYSVLEEKKVYQTLVKDIPDKKFREILESQEVVSMLHFPIFVDGRFHGFIGFDDCTQERIWNEEEIQYLQTLGTNIANAIKLRHTTGELKTSEYKFKSMVEEGGDLIQILDVKGHFKFLSPNIRKVLGWSIDELQGENAFEFIHPDDLVIVRDDFTKILNNKNTAVQPFRFKNKNGSWSWLKSSVTNFVNDEIINGILVTSTDITEQKYYNELQKLERDILEKNALKKFSSKKITEEFLQGIEKIHSAIRTSITLIKNDKLSNFSSPSLPKPFLEALEGTEIGPKAGSCGTAAYLNEQVIVTNIFEDPLWEDYHWLGKEYNFSACWSEPISDANDEAFATFAIYYDEPSSPTEFEHNTVERAVHIIRILFESEEKERAERELANSEKRFKALVHEGSDLIGILDKEFRFKYISPSVGRTHNEYEGVNALDLVHPDDYERVKFTFQQLRDEKRVVMEPYRLRNLAGNYYWVETILTNLLDEPAVEGYVANSRNVTQQIEREEKLRELSYVAAKTTDAVVITDSEGYITWVNNGFKKLTGYKLKDIEGKKPGSFLQGPETDPETVGEISISLTNRESIETTILNYSKDGTPYWLNMSIDPIFNDAGECTHFIAIERDVSEKIRKEKELQESLERYDIVNKATSDTIWDLDITTDQMLYNSNIYNMFGYTTNEVRNVGTWWKNKIHPDDFDCVDEALKKVLKNGDDRFQMEYRFKAADGSYKYIFDRAFVIKDEEGVPVRMIGAMQDITNQREEQNRLKLLESVITNTSESVVILNAEKGTQGREIIFVNEAFTRLTGYSSDEVMGETLHLMYGPETSKNVRNSLRNCMDNFEPVEVEFINYKKDGSKFWINTLMVPVQNNEGIYTHWVAIGRDITEQKQNEKAIKASLTEKETLLAEIHHRVKNNLAVVSGMMQLQAYESENKELQHKLYDSVVRIKTMATVHELLYQSNSFSQLEFSETLNNLVQNISETLQPNTNIDLRIECDPIKLNINQAIPASLIVNEIITNAYKHAFKNSDSGSIHFKLVEQEELITMKITDDGAGFSDENIMNKGSLGLHLVQALSDQIEGTYEYRNREDQNGTFFLIQFKRQEMKSGIGNANMN